MDEVIRSCALIGHPLALSFVSKQGAGEINVITNFFNLDRQRIPVSEGKIVKQNDHLMDATRYWVMSGRERLSMKPPAPSPEYQYRNWDPASQANRWMV
jgi:hypothetical protein